MPTVELTDEQVVSLIEQLPQSRKHSVVRALLTEHWPEWEEITAYGEVKFRQVAAQRGLDWTTMSDEQRISFVDDLVHEDRPCS